MLSKRKRGLCDNVVEGVVVSVSPLPRILVDDAQSAREKTVLVSYWVDGVNYSLKETLRYRSVPVSSKPLLRLLPLGSAPCVKEGDRVHVAYQEGKPRKAYIIENAG